MGTIVTARVAAACDTRLLVHFRFLAQLAARVQGRGFSISQVPFVIFCLLGRAWFGFPNSVSPIISISE